MLVKRHTPDQAEKDKILLDNPTPESKQFWCLSCGRGRDVKDRVIKVVLIRGIPPKQTMCIFCGPK